MAQRRPPHKTAHGLNCPNGVFNWADCDAAAERVWGQCKAMLDSRPETCSRWAVSDEGYCGQHYASKVESEKQAARIAIAKAELDARITAYLEWRKTHPSVWDGVAGVAGVEPTHPVLETERPPRLTPGRPFRLTELA